MPHPPRRRTRSVLSTQSSILSRLPTAHSPPSPLAAELAQSSAPQHAAPAQTQSSALSPQSSPDSPLPTPHSPPSPLSLLIWTAAPHIAPYISLYRKHIAHLDHRKAIDALKEIIDSSDDPIEKRRAASSMLRLLNQGRGGAAASPRPSSNSALGTRDSALPRPDNSIDEDDALIDQADDEDPSENSAPNSALGTQHSAPSSLATALAAKNAADFPSPGLIPYHFKSTTPVLSIPEAFADKPGQVESVPHVPLPDPGRAANDVALLAMKAIQSPDDPCDGAGARILFNLQGYIRDRSLAAFSEYKNNYLRNCVGDAWHYTDCKLDHHSAFGNKTRFQAALTLSNGSLHYLFINLEKIPGGTLKDCWVIDHLYFDYKPAPPIKPPPKPPPQRNHPDPHPSLDPPPKTLESRPTRFHAAANSD